MAMPFRRAGRGQGRRGRKQPDPFAPVRESPLMRPLGALVALLSRPVAGLGGDAGQFRAIVDAKLRIDLRQGGLKNPNRPARGGLALTCLMYAIAGIAWLGLAVFATRTAFEYMTFVVTVSMIMLAMSLVTDFLSLIMDPADLSVIAPRPVSDRTLLLARVAHVGLYLALVMGSLMLGPMVMGCVAFGPAAWLPALLLVVPLAGLGVLMLVLTVFLLVLRLVGPDRVRSVMLGAQMVMSLGIFAGWQAMAVAVRRDGALDWLRAEDASKLLLPPYWFGSLAELFASGPTGLRAAGAALALLVPPLLAAVVLRLASARRLAAMAAMAGSDPDARGAARPGLMRRLGALLTQPGPERAGWDMFLSVARHDRMFRMRVYPMLVIPLVFVAIFAFSGGEGHEQVSLAAGAAFLPAIYSFIILVQTRYSETHRAAWIFSTAPVERWGLFTSGVVRALCCCFLLPWLLLVLGLTASVTGRGRWIDAAFTSLAVVTATFVLAGLLTRRTLPFTQEMVAMDGASNVVALMFGSLLMGLLFGLWFVLKTDTRLLAGATVVLLPVCWLMARRLRSLRVEPPPADVD